MIAIDTNVFVYAVNADDPDKSSRAVALLHDLEAQPTVLLWQVACEFGAVMQRERIRGRVHVDAQKAVDAWSAIYPLVTPTPRVLWTGWRLARDLKMSYWDAMLIGACVEAGVSTIYTEDMQGSPTIDGVAIVNPFV